MCGRRTDKANQHGGPPCCCAGPSGLPPPVETPPLGCLHPEYKGGAAYFGSPADYMKWWVACLGHA